MSDPTWDDIRGEVPCTYRQFDHWATKGYIHATWTPGTGNVRTITRAEVTVLALMTDLVSAGLTPTAAAALARQLAHVDVATLGKFNVSRAASSGPTEPESQSRRASMGWEWES
jgi:hypothetical protein